MLRRVAAMAFAPRMMVFPGGGVDPRDADPRLPWAGPSPREWAGRLGCDEAAARELVVRRRARGLRGVRRAARRPVRRPVVADVSGPEWQRAAAALLDRCRSLAEVLIAPRAGAALRPARRRAHWVTPEFEPRRYDTWFFAALLPAGQVADDLTTEADQADWTPGRAAAGLRSRARR